MKIARIRFDMYDLFNRSPAGHFTSRNKEFFIDYIYESLYHKIGIINGSVFGIFDDPPSIGRPDINYITGKFYKDRSFFLESQSYYSMCWIFSINETKNSITTLLNN